MATARSHKAAEHEKEPSITPTNTPTNTAQAWEQIENGRYMPRRIRGSLRGRELG